MKLLVVALLWPVIPLRNAQNQNNDAVCSRSAPERTHTTSGWITPCYGGLDCFR